MGHGLARGAALRALTALRAPRQVVGDGPSGVEEPAHQPGSVRLEITGLIAEGDNVALQWTSRGRTLDGRAYENQCIGVFTVRDGKIGSVHEYMDTHYAYRALTAPDADRRRPRRGRRIGPLPVVLTGMVLATLGPSPTPRSDPTRASSRSAPRSSSAASVWAP